MSSTKASNAVLAIARAKFGKRITAEDLMRMASLTGVAEVAEYLKKTRFAEEMEKSGVTQWRRGSLEAVLKKQSMAEIYDLCGFEKKIGSPVLSLYVMELEVDEIISFVRFLAAGQPEKYIYTMPPEVRELAGIDLVAMSQIQTGEELTDFLSEYELYRPALQTIRKAENGQINLTPLEAGLDRIVYRKSLEILKENFSGNELIQLQVLVKLKAEAGDIETIYRAKRFFGETPDMIRTLMVGDGALLNKRQTDRLIHAENTEEFCRILRETAYGRYLTGEGEPESFSFTLQVLFERLIRCIHFSSCPAAVTLAYISYLSIEQKNIIHIIEGVRYGLPAEEIVKTLHIMRKQEVE